MSRARRAIICPREPIGLSAEESGAYLGISANTFKSAVDKGLLPGPHELLGRLLWDAEELKSAFRGLPRRQTSSENLSSGEVDWGDVAA